MKITHSQPFESVIYTLLFKNREPAHTRFHIESLSDGHSRVIWSYDVDFGSSIIGRYFGLVLDKAVGPDYEAGLKNLKQLLESDEVTAEPLPDLATISD